MVAVGNTPWYGGGMKVCPAADPTDGLFDVTVVGATTRRELIRPAPADRRDARRAPGGLRPRAARVELATPA